MRVMLKQIVFKIATFNQYIHCKHVYAFIHVHVYTCKLHANYIEIYMYMYIHVHVHVVDKTTSCVQVNMSIEAHHS